MDHHDDVSPSALKLIVTVSLTAGVLALAVTAVLTSYWTLLAALGLLLGVLGAGGLVFATLAQFASAGDAAAGNTGDRDNPSTDESRNVLNVHDLPVGSPLRSKVA